MAEGPLTRKHQGLERDAQEVQESWEGVTSSSTKDSGSRKNGPCQNGPCQHFTSTSDKSSSVKCDDPPSFLSVVNSSLPIYESRDSSRRTDSDISFIDDCRRNPPQPQSVQGGRPSRRRQLSENRTNRAQSRQPTGTSAIATSGNIVHAIATSATESGASQSFCSGPNRSSHCDNPYKYHGCCPEECTNFMFNAILHCSLLDEEFAHEVKRELETLTLSFGGQNYRPRVALLYSLTGKPPLEAFHEIKSNTMTTNIIILRTENYERDKKAEATGMKIRDDACGTPLEVTTLNCSPSEKARCDAIHYRPQSKSFRADMINILLGKYFRKQLHHDGCRRKCEEDCLRNLPLRHSESFTEHSAAGTQQQFQRTHSLPNTSNSRRKKKPTRKNQNDESARSEISTDDTESKYDRGVTFYACKKRVVYAQDSIQKDTDLSESSSTDPKSRPMASSSSGHRGDVSSTDTDSLTSPTQLIRGTENNQRRTGTPSSHDSQADKSGMKSGRSTETSAASGSNNNALEFTESELSSASGFEKEIIRTFNPIPSSSTALSDSSDGPVSRPQHSKKPIFHVNGPSRGNLMITNIHESSSSSQELKSDCQYEIKKSKTTEKGGTESNRRQVATVSPMSTFLPDEADHQTVQKTLWTAGHVETELSLSNQEGVQGTRNHQNSRTGHQARQQTTDVQRCITEQQHPGINLTRDMLGEELSESPGLQGFTQDLDSQQNNSSPLPSSLEGNDGSETEDLVTNPPNPSANTRERDGNKQQERRRGSPPSGLLRRFTSLFTCASHRNRGSLEGNGGSKTEDLVTNPPNSSANTREGDGNQQQEIRRGSPPSGLLRRFTSLFTCASRRNRGTTPGAKGQKQKPP